MTTIIKKLIEKYSDKLKDYEHVENPSELKIGSFIRYIKKKTAESPEKLAHGGKLLEISYDTQDKTKVYKLKLENTYGGSWFIKIENVYLFYKTQTTTEKRKQDAEEWKKALTPYEKKKFNEMKKKVSEEISKLKQKEIRNEFYTWLNARKENKK